MAISYCIPNLTHSQKHVHPAALSLFSNLSRQICPFLIPSNNSILHFLEVRAPGGAGVQPLARRSVQRMGFLEAGQRGRRARDRGPAATVRVSKPREDLLKGTGGD